MYFDGVWETLEDGRMEYENGKVIAFCLRKDATFEQFIAKLYGILKKRSDEYSLIVKTNVKSTHPTQPIDSLPRSTITCGWCEEHDHNWKKCENPLPVNLH